MSRISDFIDLLNNFSNNLAGGSVELKVNTNDLVRRNDNSVLYAPKRQHTETVPGHRMGIFAIVCGILSILTGLLPFLSIPLGIIGIVCSLISRSHSVSAGNPMQGLAIGGLITSVLGLLGGGFWGILWIIAAASI